MCNNGVIASEIFTNITGLKREYHVVTCTTAALLVNRKLELTKHGQNLDYYMTYNVFVYIIYCGKSTEHSLPSLNIFEVIIPLNWFYFGWQLELIIYYRMVPTLLITTST